MLPAGTTLSRYVIEGPIGSGGMGSVYRARDTHLDREVALKVLSEDASSLGDSDARNRMVREARAVATLNHPNAVAIYDAGDSDHGPFIVMELVEGETLRNRMADASPGEIIEWMSMTGLALHAAHGRGIVHRDIKPENLMIRRDGIVKVLDFGIARRQRSAVDGSAPTAASLPTLTNTGVQIGTPQYMAPEQIKGKDLDGRADQFAWAVTTYEALAGKLPWSTAAGALGVVASILEEAPDDISTLRPDCPAHVGAVLARAMAKEPIKRYPNMEAAAHALRGDSPTTSPGPKIERAPAAPRAPETRVGPATMQAVIGKALELEKVDDRYSRSEVAEAARELGISPDALAAATAAIKGERQLEPIRERIRENKRRAFLYHLVAYIGVNLIIVLPPLIIGNPGNKAAALFVPAISWGIGLVIHAMAAFRAIQPKDIRREIEKEERAVARHVARRQALARHADHREEKRARRHKGRPDLQPFAKPAKDLRIAVSAHEAEEIDLVAKAEADAINAEVDAELAELDAAAIEEEARLGVRPLPRPQRR